MFLGMRWGLEKGEKLEIERDFYLVYEREKKLRDVVLRAKIRGF